MTRTRGWVLLLLAVVGVVLGFLMDLILAAIGRAVVAPPLTLAVTVAAASLVVVGLAIPIQRSIRGRRGPVDPFHATRIVVLAKASSRCGALILGFGAGITLYLLSRPVISSPYAVWLAVATAAAGILLMVAGLIAERLCTLPPDDRGPHDDDHLD